jgi:undecaprenyl phosphate-alpha-L-ara4N flippase subunit ArnF
MRTAAINYLYIAGTIFFTVYGQLIMKWRIGHYGNLPVLFKDKLAFLFRVLFDPFILSGFLAAFVASLCWMAAMTKFPITFAYPFMSISFGLVLILGVIFLGETFTLGKMVGLLLIGLGIVATVKL